MYCIDILFSSTKLYCEFSASFVDFIFYFLDWGYNLSFWDRIPITQMFIFSSSGFWNKWL